MRKEISFCTPFRFTGKQTACIPVKDEGKLNVYEDGEKLLPVLSNAHCGLRSLLDGYAHMSNVPMYRNMDRTTDEFIAKRASTNQVEEHLRLKSTPYCQNHTGPVMEAKRSDVLCPRCGSALFWKRAQDTMRFR